MKKVVKLVKSYDDLHLQQGQEVEADIEVEIRFGDEDSIVLDLTAAHADELRRDVKKFTAAGQTRKPEVRKGYRRPPGSPGLPVARTPTKGMTRDEGNAFLLGLRVWAAGEGRDDEIMHKGGSGYSYGERVVDDYKAYLAVLKHVS